MIMEKQYCQLNFIYDTIKDMTSLHYQKSSQECIDRVTKNLENMKAKHELYRRNGRKENKRKSPSRTVVKSEGVVSHEIPVSITQQNSAPIPTSECESASHSSDNSQGVINQAIDSSTVQAGQVNRVPAVPMTTSNAIVSASSQGSLTNVNNNQRMVAPSLQPQQSVPCHLPQVTNPSTVTNANMVTTRQRVQTHMTAPAFSSNNVPAIQTSGAFIPPNLPYNFPPRQNVPMPIGVTQANMMPRHPVMPQQSLFTAQLNPNQLTNLMRQQNPQLQFPMQMMQQRPQLHTDNRFHQTAATFPTERPTFSVSSLRCPVTKIIKVERGANKSLRLQFTVEDQTIPHPDYSLTMNQGTLIRIMEKTPNDDIIPVTEYPIREDTPLPADLNMELEEGRRRYAIYMQLADRTINGLFQLIE